VTAYLFTCKRFMCGGYLCRHRIAPGTLTANEAATSRRCNWPRSGRRPTHRPQRPKRQVDDLDGERRHCVGPATAGNGTVDSMGCISSGGEWGGMGDSLTCAIFLYPQGK